VTVQPAPDPRVVEERVRAMQRIADGLELSITA
jgi:hypothetical protein